MLILHLSDIHFRQSEIGTVQDPNFHLRNELVRDVIKQCKKLGPPDVIIVSGDVAFAGAPEEFAFATKWLAELCEQCGCATEAVFVVPGNHDVVRAQADSNLVQMVHRTIKAAGDDPDYEIAKQLRDPAAQRLLYESLDNYNQFAMQFFCDLLPPERTRATRDLMLNDGSILRLWGLNSAFLSSSHDERGDLFVDPASFQITRQDGVTNLVVTHHHLSWLRQARALEDHLNTVAPVQIFGHIHINRIDRNRNFLRLTASAANPDRREPGWEPGYNFIRLQVEGGPDSRVLHSQSYVRVWQTAPTGFYPKMDDDSLFFEHTIRLEDWNPPVPKTVHANDVSSLNEPEAIPDIQGEAIDNMRELALRFYRLAFSQKMEIAGRLELLEEEDMQLPDFERFRRIFIRASSREIVGQLADAVTAAEQG